LSTSYGRLCAAGSLPARYGAQTAVGLGRYFGSIGDIEVDIVFPGIDFNTGGVIEIAPDRPSFSTPFGQQIETTTGRRSSIATSHSPAG
jgi:hypothetical protein